MPAVKTQIVMELANDILRLVKTAMTYPKMRNPKVGYNTIAPDSDLFRSTSVRTGSGPDLVFDILLNDYLKYIESGRRKGARFPPVEPIVKWLRKRGMPTDNSTVFLIRRAIARDGIRPRPLMDTVFRMADDSFDRKWADEIFKEITKILDEFFNE